MVQDDKQINDSVVVSFIISDPKATREPGNPATQTDCPTNGIHIIDIVAY